MQHRHAKGGTLVLGGGFAGGYVGRLLGNAGCTIVSRENFMLYTPTLPEAASGTLEPRHVVVPLRMMCPHADLVLGEITQVDEGSRQVTVETEAGGVELEYKRPRRRARRRRPHAPDPGPRRARAGFQGPRRRHRPPKPRPPPARGGGRGRRSRRSPGATSRSSSSARAMRASRRWRSSPTSSATRSATTRACAKSSSAGCSWTLRPKILPEIPHAARRLRGAPARQARRRHPGGDHAGFAWRSTPRRSRTASGSTRTRSSGRRGFGRPLSSAGSGCRSTRGGASRSTRRSASRSGRTCGRSATAPGCPNEATPGQFDPPTCQHALRQARRLAKNLRGEPKPYRYRMLGQVATLGRHKGIADVLGLRFRGFIGWFITRTYHLYQLPLVTRKLRVVTDWTVGALLPPRHRRALDARARGQARR